VINNFDNIFARTFFDKTILFFESENLFLISFFYFVSTFFCFILSRRRLVRRTNKLDLKIPKRFVSEKKKFCNFFLSELYIGFCAICLWAVIDFRWFDFSFNCQLHLFSQKHIHSINYRVQTNLATTIFRATTI
jgi:hypothetical protein